jgi:lipid-A-disaccharide synthase
VVIYKTSFLTWALAKGLIKIPYIGLVNVVAGKRIVPECVQFSATPLKIAEAVKEIFTHPTIRSTMIQELRNVKGALGAPGASERAAEKIVQFLK